MSGRASKSHIAGTSGNLANVTSGNALKTDSSNRRYYPIGKIRVGNLNYVRLPNVPCSVVRIRNPEGNGPVYVGGSAGTYLATAGIMDVIYETELVEYEVNNANELSLIADNLNTDILVSCLSNEDLTITVANPPPPDNTPPTISSTVPTTGAVTVQWNTAISILFSEELDSATITNTNITIAPAISYTVSKDSVNPLKVVILPAANLAASTLYTVTAKVGLRDIAGNPLAVQFTYSFTTSPSAPGADVTPPTVVSVTPANNSTDNSLSTSPTVSFSEAMLTSTIITANFNLFQDSNNSVMTVAAITLSADAKTATLTVSGLTYSTKYRLEVTTAVKDASGNSMAAKNTTFFTTVAAASSVVYQVSGNNYYALYVGAYSEVLEVCNTIRSNLYGKKIQKYTFNAYKVGSPTGNVTVNIYDNNKVLKHTFTEVLPTASMTGSDKQYTLNSTGNTNTMGTGWYIGVKYNGGDGSNFIQVGYAVGSSYNSSDSFLRVMLGTLALDYTDSDVAAIMTAG